MLETCGVPSHGDEVHFLRVGGGVRVDRVSVGADDPEAHGLGAAGEDDRVQFEGVAVFGDREAAGYRTAMTGMGVVCAVVAGFVVHDSSVVVLWVLHSLAGWARVGFPAGHLLDANKTFIPHGGIFWVVIRDSRPGVPKKKACVATSFQASAHHQRGPRLDGRCPEEFLVPRSSTGPPVDESAVGGPLSGADEPGNGVGGFLDLGLRFIPAELGRIEDAVPEVVIEESEGDAFQRLGDGRDLGEDVDAVLFLIDHAVNASGLAFDAFEPSQIFALVTDIAVRGVA